MINMCADRWLRWKENFCVAPSLIPEMKTIHSEIRVLAFESCWRCSAAANKWMGKI